MIPARCSSGLSHEQNIAKMRLLTFMGMAVEFKEISFDTMQQELQIGADEVEAFVIDGKRLIIPSPFGLRGNLEAGGVSHAFPPTSPPFPAVRTKMVYCKIDQTQRKVVVRYGPSSLICGTVEIILAGPEFSFIKLTVVYFPVRSATAHIVPLASSSGSSCTRASPPGRPT